MARRQGQRQRETDRDRQRERDRESDRDRRETESVRECICVCLLRIERKQIPKEKTERQCCVVGVLITVQQSRESLNGPRCVRDAFKGSGRVPGTALTG